MAIRNSDFPLGGLGFATGQNGDATSQTSLDSADSTSSSDISMGDFRFSAPEYSETFFDGGTQLAVTAGSCDGSICESNTAIDTDTLSASSLEGGEDLDISWSGSVTTNDPTANTNATLTVRFLDSSNNVLDSQIDQVTSGGSFSRGIIPNVPDETDSIEIERDVLADSVNTSVDIGCDDADCTFENAAIDADISVSTDSNIDIEGIVGSTEINVGDTETYLLGVSGDTQTYADNAFSVTQNSSWSTSIIDFVVDNELESIKIEAVATNSFSSEDLDVTFNDQYNIESDESSTLFSINATVTENTYSCSLDNDVNKFNTSGNVVWTFTNHTDNINDMVVDARRNLYTASDDLTVRKINEDSSQDWSTNIATEALSVAADNDGNAYVGGADNSIRKVSNGVVDWFFTNPGDDVVDLALSSSDNLIALISGGTLMSVSTSGPSENWSTNILSSTNLIDTAQGLNLTTNPSGDVFVAVGGNDGSSNNALWLLSFEASNGNENWNNKVEQTGDGTGDTISLDITYNDSSGFIVLALEAITGTPDVDGNPFNRGLYELSTSDGSTQRTKDINNLNRVGVNQDGDISQGFTGGNVIKLTGDRIDDSQDWSNNQHGNSVTAVPQNPGAFNTNR